MDYNQARMEFEQYLNDYDRTDGKVKLKITHTYGVVARSGQIAERMGLSAEDRELAKMIALLHDIGRIEQLKRYDSFLPETMDHAAYGADEGWRCKGKWRISVSGSHYGTGSGAFPVFAGVQIVGAGILVSASGL